jgi:hypothetical protein
MKEKLKAFLNNKELKNLCIEVIESFFKENKYNNEISIVEVLCGTDNHSLFPIKLGLPEEIAYLIEIIFDCLYYGDNKNFALDFVKNTSLGADLSNVCSRLQLYLINDSKSGLISLLDKSSNTYDITIEAFKNINLFYEKMLLGDINENDFLIINGYLTNIIDNVKVNTFERDIIEIIWGGIKSGEEYSYDENMDLIYYQIENMNALFNKLNKPNLIIDIKNKLL